MGRVCPIVTDFRLTMSPELAKNKLFLKKSSQKINQTGKPPIRMPIETHGLVQLNFIHNLL